MKLRDFRLHFDTLCIGKSLNFVEQTFGTETRYHFVGYKNQRATLIGQLWLENLANL